MNEPGGLEDLGSAGQHAWQELVERCLSELIERVGTNRFVLAKPDERTPYTTMVDWSGFPLRVMECVRRARALALLDWRTLRGDQGRRRLQEEYIEWRVVRDGRGIRRVEVTSELSDYWRMLAAHNPHRTLELVAGFAREREVPVDMVYRGFDPFASSATPGQREAAFAAAMLAADDPSPYNDGRRAMCVMVQPSNGLRALLLLAMVATQPRVVRDPVSGRLRCLSCEEAIPLMRDAAQGARASDPLLVERLGRLAYEGRLVAFDHPLGIYIQSVEHTRLRTRDDDPIPPDWFSFGRGLGPAETPDGRPRWQRLTLEPPAESGVRIDDLVDVATEQPIRYGGQIAELVQVAVVLRVSAPEAVPPGALEPTQLAAAVADAADCAGVRRDLAQFGRQRPGGIQSERDST